MTTSTTYPTDAHPRRLTYCEHHRMDHGTYQGFCTVNGAPCELHAPAPVHFCTAMERSPERGHFCPDCFSSGKYAQVYRRDPNVQHIGPPSGLIACACGQVWPSLLEYLRDKGDTTGDLMADHQHDVRKAREGE